MYFAIAVNVFLAYRFWRYYSDDEGAPPTERAPLRPTKPSSKHVSKLVTVVIRDFELNENDLSGTIQSFLNVFPSIQVLLVSNGLPYPPLEILYSNSTPKNLRLLNLENDFYSSYANNYPLSLIKTKYVLFVPDSTRVANRQAVSLMLNELQKSPNVLIASQFSNRKNLTCLDVEMNQREWTVKYKNIQGALCDAVVGKHVVLLETDILRTLNDAFLMPFPKSLYLQTSVLRYKVRYIYSNHLFNEIELETLFLLVKYSLLLLLVNSVHDKL